MRILKDLECTEIAQKRPACEVQSQEVHPLFFAKSVESTDCKGLLKSRDAKECVSH